MLCDQCGKDNPPDNKYCGECGSKLKREDAAGPVSSAFRREVAQQELRLQRINEGARSYSKSEPSPVEDAAASTVDNEFKASDEPRRDTRDTNDDVYSPTEASYTEPPISGPSFLGLNAPAGNTDLSYLYEDEPRPGRVRRIIAVLIVIGFAAFIGYEWRQNPNWHTTIVGRHVDAAIDAARKALPWHKDAANNPDVTSQPNPGATQAPNTPSNGSAATIDQNNAGSQQSGPSEPNASQGSGSSEVSNRQNLSPENETAQPQNANKPTENQMSKTGTETSGVTPDDVPSQDNAKTRPSPNRPGYEQSAMTEQKNTSNASAPDAQSSAEARRNRQSVYARPEQSEDALIAKADAYLYGRGVPRNCEQALVYLRTAANRGNPDARSKLGGLYATGNCVRMDRAEAYNWFTLARDAGSRSIWLERNRQMLWSQMTPAERSRVLQPQQ